MLTILEQLAPVAGVAPPAPDPTVRAQAFRMKDVLRVLADGRARSTVEIAEHLGASMDTTQKILRRLVVKGLVERAGTVAHTRIALWRKRNA